MGCSFVTSHVFMEWKTIAKLFVSRLEQNYRPLCIQRHSVVSKDMKQHKYLQQGSIRTRLRSKRLLDRPRLPVSHGAVADCLCGQRERP